LNSSDKIALEAIAARLDEAARRPGAIPQLPEPLTLAQAYEVQKLLVARRYGRGERRAGVKMGFTSQEKMDQMGVHDQIWGRLTDAMRIPAGSEIRRRSYVHPRVEPEIAVRLKRPLAGQVSIAEAKAAVDGVAPALEVIDSRYEAFRFSLTDVVADNSSSSGFVLGEWQDPGVDISNLAMRLFADGQLREEGSSAAVLGDPWRAVVSAARLAAEAGEPLAAGDVIMTGGATAAMALAGVRQARLEVAGLGSVELFVAD
jgi:2-oxo-3-hexenedioate decarboxylase